MSTYDSKIYLFIYSLRFVVEKFQTAVEASICDKWQ